MRQAVAGSHYNMIANIVQATAHHHTKDESERRFRPGDVVSGGMHTLLYRGLLCVNTKYAVLPFYRKCFD